MSLFTRRAAPGPEKRAISESDVLFAARRGFSTAGQTVTDDTSMRLMAVWRCRHLLADIVSGLPIDEYQKVGKARRPAEVMSAFVENPSMNVDPNEWRYQMVLSAASCGNGYAYGTTYDNLGYVTKAESLEPNDVRVTRKGAFGAAEYRVNGTLVDPDRMLHLRAFGPRPGSVMGMNPIEYARTTIGLGLAVRDFGATWYESGGHPTSLLTTEQDVDDADALAAKEKFRQATTADHIAVMGNGWDLKSVQVAPDDALFLAASNASGIDICGYHGIPPEMLGYATAGGSVTYANREQRAIDLLTWTVQWWIGRMERLITRQLPPTRYVKISVDGLLRSDALTRWTVHDKAVRLGARNVDEVRALEDELPIPGEAGQPYLWPPAGATLPPEVEDPAEKAKENENLTGPMATGGTND